MKQPALVPTLLAVTFAVSGAMVLAPGCGSSPAGTGGTAGTGGGTTTSGGTGGGTTTSATGNAACDAFCTHLSSINCNILKDCKNDCENHLNAPAACIKEADALLACWQKNSNDFMCTKTQVLPPPQCADEEKAFNNCVNGGGPDASCICSPGVGVGDGVTSCSRKTTCATTEFVQTCQKLMDGQPWTCSCFANGGLLGTCPEDAQNEHCSNQYGCCVPLFCAASSE